MGENSAIKRTEMSDFANEILDIIKEIKNKASFVYFRYIFF